jgi:hypothetical protein
VTGGWRKLYNLIIYALQTLLGWSMKEDVMRGGCSSTCEGDGKCVQDFSLKA